MRIAVDVGKCIGAGQCVLWAHDVFAQSDDDGLVILLIDRPESGQEPSVREAALLCPARAILVEDDQ